jgi:hypothetical protein
VLAAVGVWSVVRAPLEQALARRVVSPPVAEPVLSTGASTQLPRLSWLKANEIVASLASQLPAGATMAASEVGLIGASARQVSVIDLVGLNDTTIGRGGFSMDYLMSRRPDFIWLPHTDYTGLRAAILGDGRLMAQYDVVPGAFRYGIAIRREGQHARAVAEIVDTALQQAYPGRALRDFVARP